VHELPFACAFKPQARAEPVVVHVCVRRGGADNANADANLSASEWSKVYVLHDIVVQRRRGWARSGHASVIEGLTRDAKRLLRP
jgi:hypothetical protein